MPRGKAADKSDESKFVELVSPEGHRKVTPTNVLTDSQLRFQGYLPTEQAELEAPSREERTGAAVLELGGEEKTEGTY